MVVFRLIVVWLLVFTVVFAAGPSSTLANTFVSFNGQFLFSYPENWLQIDYTTAEYYLTRGDPNKVVDFEAVFSVRETMVLFQGQYLILTVDTLGTLTPEQIDSVVAVTSEEFKRPVREVASEAFLVSPSRDSLLFDRADGMLAVETVVPGNDAGSRVNLLVMKFYPRGIANFYFYAPETEFAAALTDYRDMVMSFSTENLDQALGRDSVKIAEPKGEGEIASKYIFMFAGLVVIILAILVVRTKRAKN